MAGSCVASRRYKGPLHWASKNCVKYLILHVGKTPVFQIQMDLVVRSMMIYDMKVLWYISMGELCRNARLQGSSHKVCVSFCHVLFLMSCLITHEKQLEASLQERTQTSGVGNCGAVDSF